ncbi:MAG: hypothetical protein PUB21_10895 [Bacteroidales bacterium]|nr:hypothetical protein [Bacteroidales bacterium]
MEEGKNGSNTAAQAVPEGKREALLNKLREWYPDTDLNDDETVFGTLAGHIEKLDSELSERRKRDEELVCLIERDPVIGALLKELYTGKEKSAAHMIRRLFGKNLLELDDEGLKESDAEARKRIEEEKRREKITAEQDENWEKSIPVLKRFCSDAGIPDDEVPLFLDFIFDAGDKIILSKPFDRPMLEMFYKAMHYDDDLTEAENRGRIRGVNEKIVLRRKAFSGDEVPNPTGRHAETGVRQNLPPAPKSMLELGGYQPARRRR